MKGLSLVGLVLIALGLVLLLVGGISYTKDQETADLGPIDITVKEKKHVAVPPPVSAGIVVAGVVLLVMGMSRKSGSA